MDTPSLVAVLFVLVLLSGYFSATETAFTSLNRIRLKSRAEGGDRRAGVALVLAEDYDNLISTVLVGNNIVNIAASTVGTVLFTKLCGDYGPVISTVVLTVVILLFGEVSPKSMAKEAAESFAMFSAPVLRVLMLFLRPVNALLSLVQRLLKRLVHKSGGEGITEEELITMVSEAESEGGLDRHESELIRSAIEFNDMDVDEILTPRVDVVAAEDTATMDQVAALFAQSGYSRLPIYHESIDNIVGVLHEKDFYACRYHGQTSYKQALGSVIATTGGTKISQLLRILQQAKAHMAVVVDEYGGTEGIVTLEDILEELVGEIWDEHDEVIEQFQKQPDGSYLISCSADLTDLYDLFTIKGDCDAATVSGWVMEQIGRVPEVGDRFQSDGLDVTVTQVDHRRVLEIQVVVLPKRDAEESDK